VKARESGCIGGKENVQISFFQNSFLCVCKSNDNSLQRDDDKP